MPTILLKKSDTPGSVPSTSQITNLPGGAEVAINTADKRMFTMNSSSAVVELGTNPSSLSISNNASINILTATTATITTLNVGSLNLTSFSLVSANITTLTGSSANITTATHASANITTLGSSSANITTLTGGSATITTILDGSGNVRDVPSAGAAKTSVYTLSISDVGEFITIGTGGGIDVPNGVFSPGNALAIFNNTSGNRTISLTITTAYISGTDTDKASVTLATRGLATILFISNSVCVISGAVS